MTSALKLRLTDQVAYKHYLLREFKTNIDIKISFNSSSCRFVLSLIFPKTNKQVLNIMTVLPNT